PGEPQAAPAPDAQAAIPAEPASPTAPPPVDPATLPPVDLIEAGTDIKAFLAEGVPADLTRAALRRAWAADPAIRDFVGLSENSWDFNAPGGVPGFGSLTPEDARRMMERVMGEAEPSDPVPAAAERLSDDQV